MKIGIDAFFLSEKQNTGIGEVAFRLIEKLSEIDKKNEYFLYTPSVYHLERAQKITQNKQFHIQIISSFFKNSRRLWLQSPRLIQQCKKDNIELFFAGGEYCPILLPQKIKVITTIHDVVFKVLPHTVSFTNKLFYKTLLPFCIQRTNAFITVSEHSKKEMQELLKIRKPIQVIYNGIEIQEYQPKNPPTKKPYLLFVGTLQPRKNLTNLLKAYAFIGNQIQEKLVIIGGEGWKNKTMKKLLSTFPQEILNKIEWKGYVSGNELLRYYQEAMLFIAPSLHEGFGLIILEAMASQTAVIASNAGAIPEIFGPAISLCDPYNPQDIANQILFLIQNPEKRIMQEKNGLEYAQRYTLEKTALGYLSFFEKTIY